MNRKERLVKLKTIDIYPVTCQELSEGRTNLEVLAAVLAGGAKIIQLREKHWDKKDLYELAVEFRKRTRRQHALLIINDHVDVAPTGSIWARKICPSGRHEKSPRS